VEFLVAASCILSSGAKLNVSTSMVDDEGVDLVFHRRGISASLSAQVKARLRSSKQVQEDRFVALVRQQTSRLATTSTSSSSWRCEKATFGPVWMVPSLDFASKARAVGARQNLRFSASLAHHANDQWHPYRLDREQLARRILDLLEAEDL